MGSLTLLAVLGLACVVVAQPPPPVLCDVPAGVYSIAAGPVGPVYAQVAQAYLCPTPEASLCYEELVGEAPECDATEPCTGATTCQGPFFSRIGAGVYEEIGMLCVGVSGNPLELVVDPLCAASGGINRTPVGAAAPTLPPPPCYEVTIKEYVLGPLPTANYIPFNKTECSVDPDGSSCLSQMVYNHNNVQQCDSPLEDCCLAIWGFSFPECALKCTRFTFQIPKNGEIEYKYDSFCVSKKTRNPVDPAFTQCVW